MFLKKGTHEILYLTFDMPIKKDIDWLCVLVVWNFLEEAIDY